MTFEIKFFAQCFLERRANSESRWSIRLNYLVLKLKYDYGYEPKYNIVLLDQTILICNTLSPDFASFKHNISCFYQQDLGQYVKT